MHIMYAWFIHFLRNVKYLEACYVYVTQSLYFNQIFFIFYFSYKYAKGKWAITYVHIRLVISKYLGRALFNQQNHIMAIQICEIKVPAPTDKKCTMVCESTYLWVQKNVDVQNFIQGYLLNPESRWQSVIIHFILGSYPIPQRIVKQDLSGSDQILPSLYKFSKF